MNPNLTVIPSENVQFHFTDVSYLDYSVLLDPEDLLNIDIGISLELKEANSFDVFSSDIERFDNKFLLVVANVETDSWASISGAIRVNDVLLRINSQIISISDSTLILPDIYDIIKNGILPGFKAKLTFRRIVDILSYRLLPYSQLISHCNYNYV